MPTPEHLPASSLGGQTVNHNGQDMAQMRTENAKIRKSNKRLLQELAVSQSEVLSLREELTNLRGGEYEIRLHPLVVKEIESSLASKPPPSDMRAVVAIGIDGLPSIKHVSKLTHNQSEGTSSPT